MPNKQKRGYFWLVLLLTLGSALFCGYFAQRNQFAEVLLGYGVFFGGYYFFVFNEKLKLKSLTAIFIVGMVLRLVFVLAEPRFSDDYNRFLWDGKMIVEFDEKVYSATPETIHAEGKRKVLLYEELYKKLNSKQYYSVYPPVKQILFASAVLFSKDVKTETRYLHVLLLIFDGLLFFLIISWLKFEKHNPARVAWYFLNPLVIVELHGNLHFEGVTCFFLLLAILLLRRKNTVFSAIFYSIAVGIKLVPLLFIPLLQKRFGWGRTILFGSGVLVITALCFLPFLDQQTIVNFSQSLDLYFRTFEFNASAYFVLRAFVGFFTGYNGIAIIGPVLMLVLPVIILILLFKMKKDSFQHWIRTSLLALIFFYLLSTTVHPWYIVNLVFLATLCGWKFPLYWSGLVVLSYVFYTTGDTALYYVTVFFEYALLALGYLRTRHITEV